MKGRAIPYSVEEMAWLEANRLLPISDYHAGFVAQFGRDDVSAANHFLVRLRVVHPFVAVIAASLLLWLGNLGLDREDPRARKLAAALMAAVGAQVALGIFNIILAAPGWMQIIHLLTANIVWIVAVLLTMRRASSAA